MGAVAPGDLGPAPLCGHSLAGVDGMGVVEAADHPTGVDCLGSVQRDEQLPVGIERLQTVHVVRHRRPRLALPIDEVVVPARPGGPPRRHQAGVGMQHRLVGAVRDRAQHLVLGAAGRREHCQRLVGVSGDHDLVGALGGAVEDDLDPEAVAADGAHRRAQVDPIAKGLDQRLDVPSRATGDRAPSRAAEELERAVVVEELGQEARGKRPQLVRVRRPDRGRLGDDEPLDEVGGVVAVGEEAAERRTVPVEADQAPRLAIEANQVEEHAMESWVDRVCGAREEAEGTGGPLETTVAVGDAEAHRRRLGRYRQLVEEPLEMRVVAVVEDDEAGVDAPGPG